MAIGGLKEGNHFRLPARVDGVVFHGSAALFKVVGLDVANDQAIGDRDVRAEFKRQRHARGVRIESEHAAAIGLQ